MAEKTIHIPYGKGEATLTLPQERIGSILVPQHHAALSIDNAVTASLRHPIASPPLREMVKKGASVVIVTADITRAWNHSRDFMRPLINELNDAGIPDEDISIVFAQGTHRAQTPDEDIAVVGEEVARRIRLYQHDCHDRENLVLVGTTSYGTPVELNRRVVEADFVIVTGGIMPHLFAGFGGGRKMILPGVASWETIQKNHALALSDTLGEGINPLTEGRSLTHNPVHQDMLEGMEFCRPDFLLHSLINERGEVCGFVSGDPYEAWLEGTQEVLSNDAVSFSQKADLTIVGAGGYPKDLSLYQGCKCYEPARDVTKKGGIIIALIESPDIKEPQIFWDSFRYDSRLSMEKALRQHFTIPFFVAYFLCTLTEDYTLYLVTKQENFEAVRRIHQIPTRTLEEAYEKAKAQLLAEGKTDFTVNVIPNCGMVIPLER